MTTSVDAIAVLDRYGFTCGDPESDISKARAALEELIAADKEFDAAYADFAPIGAEKPVIARCAARINAARIRRSTAIARVKGGAE